MVADAVVSTAFVVDAVDAAGVVALTPRVMVCTAAVVNVEPCVPVALGVGGGVGAGAVVVGAASMNSTPMRHRDRDSDTETQRHKEKQIDRQTDRQTECEPLVDIAPELKVNRA